jgi:ferritin-like metal-binding protein YciE
MTPNDLHEQLIKYLTDVHSIEQQALAQMERAPGIAGDPELKRQFERHLTETQEQDRMVSERLKALGADPSKLKDLAGRVTGVGFALFAKFNPDTPGKLVAHGYSYEHMEAIAYELLGKVAEQAGDTATAEMAARIEEQEREMAKRLELCFDIAVAASLRELSPDDMNEQLNSYLEDAHAIEGQAIQMLRTAPKLAGHDALAQAYEEHLRETHEHERLVDERLRARHGRPSRMKDAAMRLGALNWGGFFAAQPDTPAKLAAFAYAFEHLEIASYELMSRVAERVEDRQTVEMAEKILVEERAAADKLHDLMGHALNASLEAQGVATR